jgi:hypothetical protein
MVSASATMHFRFDRLRRLLGRLGSLPLQLSRRLDRLPRMDAPIAASVTLVAVVLSAALSFVVGPQPRATSAQPTGDAPATATASPGAPVKIVGAAPRSDNCAEQVWPYIERRCLTRPGDNPKTMSAVQGAAPSAPPARGGERATTSAAPADQVAAPQSTAAHDAAKPRVATAYLSPPRQRVGNVGADGLLVPRGAMPLPPSVSDRLSSRQDGEDAWADRAMERLMLGEPRRRIGRRGHRSRFGGRPVFGFPF